MIYNNTFCCSQIKSIIEVCLYGYLGAIGSRNGEGTIILQMSICLFICIRYLHLLHSLEAKRGIVNGEKTKLKNHTSKNAEFLPSIPSS
jgi:hypothetical protein